VLRKKEDGCRPTGRGATRTLEKLRSGDIYQVAEVVRNLSIRDKDKGLSAGEKRMLSRARQIPGVELTSPSGSTRRPRRSASTRRCPEPSGARMGHRGGRRLGRRSAVASSSSPWPGTRSPRGRCAPPGRWPTRGAGGAGRRTPTTPCPLPVPAADTAYGATVVVTGVRPVPTRSGPAWRSCPPMPPWWSCTTPPAPGRTRLFAAVVDAVRTGTVEGAVPCVNVADTFDSGLRGDRVVATRGPGRSGGDPEPAGLRRRRAGGPPRGRPATPPTTPAARSWPASPRHPLRRSITHAAEHHGGRSAAGSSTEGNGRRCPVPPASSRHPASRPRPPAGASARARSSVASA